jgi:GNAT superfamily N-acetyltransferase
MTDDVVERPLTQADVAAAAALSATVGWNQVAGDWRLMLAHGSALGLAPRDPAGGPALVATALTLPLGERLAWISMVLVDPGWRRRGLGTRVLERCIAQLVDAGIVPGLDATPAGRLVYAPLGFQALYGISRLFVTPDGAHPAEAPSDLALRPLGPEDLDLVAAWDAARSGMRRGPLLAGLRRRLPDAAWLAMRAGRIAGFVLGRDGRMSNQLGPLLADDATVARALLARALDATRAPAILDVPDNHAEFQAWLGGLGAVKQRDYTRMVLGPPTVLPPPGPLFAIAGPELG